VTNSGSNTTSVINTTNNTAYASINVGNGPAAFGQFIGNDSIGNPVVSTVTGIIPSSGPVAGGTSVTITGTNLGGATAVNFGSASATIITNSDSQITTTSPTGNGAGTVHVTVTTNGGTSTTSSADQFTYTVTPLPAPTVTGIAPTSGIYW
jgi:YVTN family beta-propeller protein